MTQSKILKSINPAQGELLWEGVEATSNDVDDAVQRANEAFEAWSSLTVGERGAYLTRFAERLKEKQQAFAEIISKETGKLLKNPIKKSKR